MAWCAVRMNIRDRSAAPLRGHTSPIRSGPGARARHRHDRRHSHGRRRRLPEFHGGGDRSACLRSAAGPSGARQDGRGSRSWRAAAPTIRPAGSCSPACCRRTTQSTRPCARSCSVRCSRSTCTLPRNGPRRSRWWIAPVHTRSPAPSSPRTATRWSRPTGRSATPRATTTSTTSPPARWWDSSRSAAGAPAGPTTRPGSVLNLLRWVSPRSIKETFAPPKDYRYPFMAEG